MNYSRAILCLQKEIQGCVSVCVCARVYLLISHHFLKQLVVYHSAPACNSRVYSSHLHVAKHKDALHYSSQLSGRSFNGCAIVYVTMFLLMDISLFPIIWNHREYGNEYPLHMEVQVPSVHFLF